MAARQFWSQDLLPKKYNKMRSCPLQWTLSGKGNRWRTSFANQLIVSARAVSSETILLHVDVDQTEAKWFIDSNTSVLQRNISIYKCTQIRE